MSTFLERMAARVTGAETTVTLRRPARFEQPAQPLRHDAHVAVPSSASVPSAGSTPGPLDGTPRTVERPRPDRGLAPQGAVAPDVAQPRTDPIAFPSQPAVAPRLPDTRNHEPEPVLAPVLSTNRGRVTNVAASSDEKMRDSAHASAAELRETRPEDQEVPPTSGPGSSPVPDPVTLVREHVVPVLVDSGMFRPGERFDVPDPDRPSRPADPQATRLLMSPPRISQSDRTQTPSSPAQPADVHVHIDRIEVVRPAAPTTPLPTRRPVPPVDHKAYLAKRAQGR